MPVSFDVSTAEFATIDRIVTRAQSIAARLNIPMQSTQTLMDITACHANGCSLRLAELLRADELTFVHDVFGIVRHIDRETGRLADCFVPRLAI